MTRTIESAMARARSATRQDFQDQIASLATMASLAPLAGLFCTAPLIIADAFRGGSFEKSQMFVSVAKGVSNAFLPTALGLFLGLVSLYSYRYFQRRAAVLDREMSVTAEAWMEWFDIVDSGQPSPSSVELNLRTLERGDSVWDRAKPASVLLAVAWLVRAGTLFWFDHTPLTSSLSAAFWSLVIPFVGSFVVFYAFWVDLLRRNRSVVLISAALFSLVWAAAKLLFPAAPFRFEF